MQLIKLEDAQWLEEARQAEEAALVEMEKAKCRAAMEAAEVAQRLPDLEAQRRRNAEGEPRLQARQRHWVEGRPVRDGVLLPRPRPRLERQEGEVVELGPPKQRCHAPHLGVRVRRLRVVPHGPREDQEGVVVGGVEGSTSGNVVA